MASQPEHSRVVQKLKCYHYQLRMSLVAIQTKRRVIMTLQDFLVASFVVQRWSVGRLVTSETTICSYYRKPFFLLEHESERAQEQKSATMLHGLKEFHSSGHSSRPGFFLPIQMFALSLQLPFMRRL